MSRQPFITACVLLWLCSRRFGDGDGDGGGGGGDGGGGGCGGVL